MLKTGYPHTSLYLFTGVVALVSCIVGLLTVLGGAGLDLPTFFAPDLVGGLILFLIAAILLSGIIEGRSDRACWVRYAYIGTLLAGICAICSVVMALGSGVTLVLEGESFDISPLVQSGFFWIGIISAPAFYKVRTILYRCSQGECSL